jgi:hypothetical protein
MPLPRTASAPPAIDPAVDALDVEDFSVLPPLCEPSKGCALGRPVLTRQRAVLSIDDLEDVEFTPTRPRHGHHRVCRLSSNADGSTGHTTSKFFLLRSTLSSSLDEKKSEMKVRTAASATCRRTGVALAVLAQCPR